jgi:putative Holliday junction resolvase
LPCRSTNPRVRPNPLKKPLNLKQTPPPRKLLALDPGGRRTGVATSDDLGLYAHPRPALLAASRDALIAGVARIVADEGAEEVVVGVPIGLHGADTGQTRAARDLAIALRERLAIDVTEWDERLSTVEASRFIHGKERRAKGDLDSAAAAVILQAVLDSRRGSGQ